MRLTKLNIKNFRTVEELTLNFPTHYSAICGKNDSGKTNVLQAIRSVFGSEESDPFTRESSVSFKDDIPQWMSKDSKVKTIEIDLELSVDPNIDNGLHSFLTTYLKLEQTPEPLTIALHSTYSSETPQGNTWIEVSTKKIERIEAENVLQKLKSSSVILFHNSTDRGLPFYFVQARRQFPIELSLGDSEQLPYPFGGAGWPIPVSATTKPAAPDFVIVEVWAFPLPASRDVCDRQFGRVAPHSLRSHLATRLQRIAVAIEIDQDGTPTPDGKKAHLACYIEHMRDDDKPEP